MIIINTIKLMHGDCLDKLKQVKNKSVNLVLIDPPYNISKAEWDTWKTVDEYVQFMGQVFLECQRVLKDNGSFYFFHNDFQQMAELQHWIKKNTKFVFKQMIVWDKFNGSKWNQLNAIVYSDDNRNYSKQAEYCLFYTFQDDNKYSQGFKKNYIRETCNFTNLRQYAKQILEDNNLTLRQVNKMLGHRKLEHFFYWNSTEWELPSKKAYEELKTIIVVVTKSYEELREEYEKEYEVLRQQYEKSRYIYNNQNLPSVWQHEPIKQNGHITPKPVSILNNIILTSSNDGDIVVDCFMGSCSTGISCLETNRNFIGIELDNTYFETCKNRVNEYIKDNNLQDIHIEIA